jgi:hypothetical protein
MKLRAALLVAASAFAAVAPAQKPAPPKTAVPIKSPLVPLKKVDYPPGTWRLGYDLAGEAPKTGYAFTAKSQTFVLFDRDGDGFFSPDGADAVGLDGGVYVVGLPPFLLCDAGWCELAFDGQKAVRLDPKDPPVGAKLIGALARLNDLRLRHGAPSLRLDPEFSDACAKHLAYLFENGIKTSDWGAANVSTESADLPGYTDEGFRASLRATIIAADTIEEYGLLPQTATAWARHALVSPQAKFGLAVHPQNRLLMYGSSVHWEYPERPYYFPADGSKDVPRAFAPFGEDPGPEPDGKNGAECGFPITVQLPRDLQKKRLVSFSLRDAKDAAVLGFASAPKSPANARATDNYTIAMFLPKAPLSPGMKYVAALSLDGCPEMKWSFTTRALR